MKTINFLKRFIVLVFLCLTVSSFSQVATTYTFAQSTGTYTAITGTVIANAASLNMDDEVFGPITIPNFVFDGNLYTSIYVNTNGHITFGAASSTTNYLALSSTEAYPGAIAAFSEDLDMAASGTRNIRYQQVGNEFIVQWTNVGRYASADRISFQIRLNTTNNQIKIMYGGTITPDANASYPEVGLRGANNTFATNINNRSVLAATGAWVNSTAGTSNTSNCYFNSATPGTVPSAGTTYTWTPAPVDMRAETIVSPGTSGCYGKTETVSVTIRNMGGTTINFATTPLTLSTSVTGPNPMTFTPVVINTGTLASLASQTVTVASASYDMSASGTYTFTPSTSVAGDAYPGNNGASVIRIGHTPSAVYPDVLIPCSGGSSTLTGTATAYPYVLTLSNSTSVAIPDATPAGVNSTIVVSGAGTVTAASVTAGITNISHTFDGDLIIKLTAPDGSSVILSNLEGGGGANFTNTVFSSSAVTAIASGTAPFTGSFIPDNPLSGFTGLANGTWTLNVSDNAAADVGVLQGWTLTFPIANGISTYSWSPAANLTSASIANPVASPPSSVTYTVTVTDQSGCTNKDNVIVTVNPLPTVTATPSTASVCNGTNITLNGGGAVSYTWTGGVSNGTSFTPAATATYTVTGTDGNGCTNTATATVTVNSLPTVVANASAAAICNGTSETLTGGGATSYTWTGGVTNGTAFTPSSTVTYTVTGTDGNGCTNTAMTTVTVNSLPTVVANASAAAICNGSSETLTGGGATSYVWTGGVSNGTAFTPSSTVTYTVTGTDGNGCVNTASTTVTVNSLPTVVANASAPSICNGTSETLTGGGATSYVWTGGVTNGTAFTPSSTVTYTVTGTDGNGCVNTDMTTVTVNSLPTVMAMASSNSICTGSNVTLTGMGTATSYSWTGGATDAIAFTPAGTVTYTVTGTDGNGCVNTASTTVTVNSLPTVVANASAPSICNGSSETLTGGGASSYTWTGGVLDGTAFTPSSTVTYTVTGTDGNGCVNTASTTVTVNSLPTVVANASAASICNGSSETLTGGGALSYTWTGGVLDGTAFTPSSTVTYTVTGTDGNGCTNTDMTTVTVNSLPTVIANASAAAICNGSSETLTGGGALSYTWTGGVLDGTAFTPSSTVTYTVTGTDGNGCVNTDMTTVTVNSLPTVMAMASSNSICTGSNVTLTGMGTATSYSWTGGATDAIAFTPAGTVTYTVTGTDGNGCVNTASTTVTVNSLPTVVANASAPSICNGSSETLTGGGASSYTWTGGVLDGTAFTPSSTVTYTVTGTDGNGCVNTASTTVTVNSLPTVVANASAASICNGSSETLTGGGALSYTWTGGVLDGTAFTPSSTVTYTVTGTDGNGCTNADMTTVTVNALPVVDVTFTTTMFCTTDASVLLNGESPAGGTWSGNGVSGASFDPAIAGMGASLITYSYTDINGCSATDTSSLYVDICTGIISASQASLNVYPNPASSFVTLAIGNLKTDKLQLEILNILGEVVYTQKISIVGNDLETQIDVSSLTKGTYMLKVNTGTSIMISKLVKQ